MIDTAQERLLFKNLASKIHNNDIYTQQFVKSLEF